MTTEERVVEIQERAETNPKIGFWVSQYNRDVPWLLELVDISQSAIGDLREEQQMCEAWVKELQQRVKELEGGKIVEIEVTKPTITAGTDFDGSSN